MNHLELLVRQYCECRATLYQYFDELSALLRRCNAESLAGWTGSTCRLCRYGTTGQVYGKLILGTDGLDVGYRTSDLDQSDEFEPESSQPSLQIATIGECPLGWLRSLAEGHSLRTLVFHLPKEDSDVANALIAKIEGVVSSSRVRHYCFLEWLAREMMGGRLIAEATVRFQKDPQGRLCHPS
jgi:hypothetical protein